MKIEEILLLEEGEYVEDCRGKTLKVSQIDIEYSHNTERFYEFCYKYFPPTVAAYITTISNRISAFFGRQLVYDKYITLEDGAYCSARNCCSYIGKTTEHKNPNT
jgi:hypothetical protein